VITVFEPVVDRITIKLRPLTVEGKDDAPTVRHPYIDAPMPGPLFIDEQLPFQLGDIEVKTREDYWGAREQIIKRMKESGAKL
jgi:hypothetical protein